MPGLALTELTLSHFRSHRRTRLALDERPVAIWGPNGAGKTNILEAVSLLSPGRGLRRVAAGDMAQRPAAPGWKVTALLGSLGHTYELATWAELGGGRQVAIGGKAAPQLALGRIGRVLWLVPAMDRLWLEGAEGRRRFLDRAVLSLEPRHAELALGYERAMRDRNRLLKDGHRDPGWYAALEAQMAKAGAGLHNNRVAVLARLAAAQKGAGSAFPAAILSLAGPDGADIARPIDAAQLAGALAEGRVCDMAAGRSLTGPHRSDLNAVCTAKGIPARDCSTGEQKALLISVILANARALAQDFGAPPILLLDEVAAHLDAGRRAALYGEIRALGAQAWMTGTGQELFDTLGARAQHVKVTQKGGLSNAVLRKG